MRVIATERLPSAETVRRHLHEHRDELTRCLIGYSGGKDSVALTKLVHEVNASVPLVYAGCPGCEWPAHEEFVRRAGAVVLDTGHSWDWFVGHPWAFLYSDSRTAERWARAHHRGLLRRYAAERGKILLWGNRTADGNSVPAVRYSAKDGCELWMPLRDLDDASTCALLGQADWSPSYQLKSCGGTSYLTGRLRGEGSPAMRYLEVADAIGHTVNFTRFYTLYEDRFGAPA